MCQMFRLLINQINQSLDQNQSQKNFPIIWSFASNCFNEQIGSGLQCTINALL
jgi:hypothetical protein